MSRLNIEKKLLAATKGWKSFTSAIQKKLHKLKKSKVINNSTKRLNTTLRTVLPRKSRYNFKKKGVRRPSSVLRFHYCKNHNNRPSYKPVYVDELFMHGTALEITSKMDKMAKEDLSTTDPRSVVNIEHSNVNKMERKFLSQPNWSAESSKGSKMDTKISIDILGCPSSPIPKLRGVDERAEEFITKFKEEMRLQRQRSFGEFQEMLARSA